MFNRNILFNKKYNIIKYSNTYKNIDNIKNIDNLKNRKIFKINENNASFIGLYYLMLISLGIAYRSFIYYIKI